MTLQSSSAVNLGGSWDTARWNWASSSVGFEFNFDLLLSLLRKDLDGALVEYKEYNERHRICFEGSWGHGLTWVWFKKHICFKVMRLMGIAYLEKLLEFAKKWGNGFVGLFGLVEFLVEKINFKQFLRVEHILSKTGNSTWVIAQIFNLIQFENPYYRDDLRKEATANWRNKIPNQWRRQRYLECKDKWELEL